MALRREPASETPARERRPGVPDPSVKNRSRTKAQGGAAFGANTFPVLCLRARGPYLRPTVCLPRRPIRPAGSRATYRGGDPSVVPTYRAWSLAFQVPQGTPVPFRLRQGPIRPVHRPSSVLSLTLCVYTNTAKKVANKMAKIARSTAIRPLFSV